MAFKVVIPEDITDTGKDFLKEKGYKVVVGDGKKDFESLKNLLTDADALIARTASYPKKVLEAAPKLKVISRFGVGLDNIDVSYCTKKGIWLTIAPEANSNAVAEHTIGFIVDSAHKITYMNNRVKLGDWEIRNQEKGRDIIGKTLGLIGLGRIGSVVAKKAVLGLEMKVIGYDEFLPVDKYPEYVTPAISMEEVFSIADFVSIHVPATEKTRNMVNKDLLSKMKDTAVLINCARGGIVNEKDLYDALKNSVIAWAAFDVLEKEPPSIDNLLLKLDNFTITPHSGALTQETMDTMGLHAAMGVDDVLNGRIPKWPANYVEK